MPTLGYVGGMNNTELQPFHWYRIDGTERYFLFFHSSDGTDEIVGDGGEREVHLRPVEWREEHTFVDLGDASPTAVLEASRLIRTHLLAYT